MEINKIILGDCINVLKTLPNKFSDLIITDPPYNISQKNLKISRKHIAGGAKDLNYDFGEWDSFETRESFLEFTQKWVSETSRILKENGTFYSFFSKQEVNYFENILRKNGFYVRAICVWHKTNPTPLLFKVGYASASEFFVFATKSKGAKHTFNYKLGQQHNVFTYPICMGKERVKDEEGKTLHPTQKPIKLIEKLILYSSNEGDLVVDPFCGVGTTCVAAKKNKRNFIGIEIEEKFINAANKRLKEIKEA